MRSLQQGPIRSAHALLTDILVSGRQVNFPVVTEICDRVEGDTRELDVVVGASSVDAQRRESQHVSTGEIADGDARNVVFRKRMSCAPFRDSLDALVARVPADGGPAEECVRMLKEVVGRMLEAPTIHGSRLERAEVAPWSNSAFACCERGGTSVGQGL